MPFSSDLLSQKKTEKMIHEILPRRKTLAISLELTWGVRVLFILLRVFAASVLRAWLGIGVFSTPFLANNSTACNRWLWFSSSAVCWTIPGARSFQHNWAPVARVFVFLQNNKGKLLLEDWLRGLFLKTSVTSRAYFGCHNPFYTFATPRFSAIKLRNLFGVSYMNNMLENQLYKTSGLQFDNWLCCLFFSFYFLNARQSDNNGNKVYVLEHKYILGELILTLAQHKLHYIFLTFCNVVYVGPVLKLNSGIQKLNSQLHF